MKEKITKERMINNILLVVLLILLVYILFLSGVIKISSKEEVKTVEEQEEKEKLKATDEVVTNLYKGVELGRSYNALRHYYFYSYDSIDMNNIDESFIKEMAISKLTINDETTSIDRSILEKGFKNIVGDNLKYKNRTFQTLCATYKYNSETDSFTINRNTSCDKDNQDNYEYFDKITSAYKYSDRIEITSRVGCMIETEEVVSEGISEKTGKIIVKKDLDSTDNIGEFTDSVEQIKKEIDYKKLSEYKYTFNKVNNKYYFYKVERVE